jgi:hypothetical protein
MVMLMRRNNNHGEGNKEDQVVKMALPRRAAVRWVWVENEKGIPRIPSLTVTWHLTHARGIAHQNSVVAEVGVGYIILHSTFCDTEVLPFSLSFTSQP